MICYRCDGVGCERCAYSGIINYDAERLSAAIHDLLWNVKRDPLVVGTARFLDRILKQIIAWVDR